MGYDEELAFRLRGALEGVDGVGTKRMFGGMAFLLDGHIVIAASGKGGLMARVDPADLDELLQQEHVGPMEMGGKTTAGWVRVDEPGYDADADLQAWVKRGLDFVRTLPPQ